jgi:Uma2 family endonuclease
MRYSREFFMEMARLGLFDNDRVELIEGEIFVMAPMAEPHARPIQHLTIALARLLPEGFTFRCQLPFAAESDSQPQPDFTIFKTDEQPEDDMPATAVLVVEVSDSSLAFDLKRKSAVYARAQVPEYWVLDVKKRELIIHRSPAGSRYRSIKHVTDLGAVKSSAVPGLVLDLRNIFIKR